MAQNFQDDAEIERRISDLASLRRVERLSTTLELIHLTVEELETKIKRYVMVVYTVSLFTGLIQFAYYPNFYYFKDGLGTPPGEYLRATSLATYPWAMKPLFGYLQDTLYLGGYRSKGWFVISCLFGIFVSTLYYLQKPSINGFILLDTLLNTAVVISDVMAQGLSVVIVSLKKAHAEAIGQRDKQRNTIVNLAVLKGQSESKKIFGNYNLMRFMIRNLGRFLGGVLVNVLSFNTVYGIIGIAQLGVLTILLIIPEKKEERWINTEAGNIFTLLKAFSKSIWRKELVLPLLLILLFRFCPDISDSGNYILTDEIGWSSLTLSLNTLCSSIVYFIAMLYLVNLAENLSFSSKMYIATIAGVLNTFVYYRFSVFEEVSFALMFSLHILGFIFTNLNFEFYMIAFVARYSTYCPKGMENFGVASVAALMNLGRIQGSIIGSKILTHYHIGSGHYEDLVFPTAIGFFFTIGVLLLTPVLGK